MESSGTIHEITRNNTKKWVRVLFVLFRVISWIDFAIGSEV